MPTGEIELNCGSAAERMDVETKQIAIANSRWRFIFNLLKEDVRDVTGGIGANKSPLRTARLRSVDNAGYAVFIIITRRGVPYRTAAPARFFYNLSSSCASYSASRPIY
ncbi:hypothetical protein DSM3645_21287 [Blastopirellula marina DSM 3645]|uniref:Uncharacterized protein n=1 Tax=Blastopirellula marina DSM 3645 TaxID=314230 RepID=A3ZR54_9BACT|nr:hypothetical protein DSM3645_21287 [Blastopirellula marina DSM 3645]